MTVAAFTPDPFPPGKAYSKGFERVGYTDLQGRPGFKMALHRVPGNPTTGAGERWYLYTAQFWCSGFSIVEVTDPAYERRFVNFAEVVIQARYLEPITVRVDHAPTGEVIERRSP
jgi:hypothetical protein